MKMNGECIFINNSLLYSPLGNCNGILKAVNISLCFTSAFKFSMTFGISAGLKNALNAKLHAA